MTTTWNGISYTRRNQHLAGQRILIVGVDENEVYTNELHAQWLHIAGAEVVFTYDPQVTHAVIGKAAYHAQPELVKQLLDSHATVNEQKMRLHCLTFNWLNFGAPPRDRLKLISPRPIDNWRDHRCEALREDSAMVVSPAVVPSQE